MTDRRYFNRHQYDGLSCLDAAYERKAIDEGLVTNPVFPENKEYIKQKNEKRKARE